MAVGLAGGQDGDALNPLHAGAGGDVLRQNDPILVPDGYQLLRAEDAGLIVVREDGVGVQHPICYYESISNLLYESKKERLDQAAAADTSLLKFTSPPKRRRWAERGKQAASHRHRLFSTPLFTCFRRPHFPLSLKNDSFTGAIVISIAEPFGRVGRSAVRESGGTASPGASSGTNARQSGSGFCETCVKTWQSSPFFHPRRNRSPWTLPKNCHHFSANCPKRKPQYILIIQ